MLEKLPELETIDSKRTRIQNEIKDLYHKLANIEFDDEPIDIKDMAINQEEGVELTADDLVKAWTSKITELETELGLL